MDASDTPQRERTPAAAGRGRWRWVWATLAVGTVALLAWSLLTPPAAAPHPAANTGTPLPAAPLVGHLAPDVTLLDLSNNPVTLSSLRGKIVVLNFWYAACEPCRYEMPIFERAYHADGARGVVVLGVNIVDDAQTTSAFVAELGIDYPIVRDRGQRAVLAYQITHTPSTFVIDRHGVIRTVVPGAISDDATLNHYLAPLLAS
ncbi:MAG TPA: TlpA disulfide reductase family protein [Ktedonobacterales bacterium]|nr:TlpA disulfide reductase family protein [Ktedonobacterales bacterium]